MSKGPLILCLLIELWRLYLTPAASETVVTGFLGQSVTLPCMYSSWSPGSNSMCWGKGSCPNSKCNEELLHTDGTKVLSKKSPKYALQGNIGRGDVSLTIFSTITGDESVYCCRIEVPGWFNDVKNNVRLTLIKAPTTTRRPTTRRPTTTTMTTTAVLPTTVVTTPALTTRIPLETRTTTALTEVTATTCPLTTRGSLPEAATILLTTELPTEGSTLTAESETFHFSSNSQTSTEVTSEDTTLLTSKESTASVSQSTTTELMWEMSDSGTFLHKMAGNLLMTIVPCLVFLLCALTVVFLLRGKVMKTNCFQKHTRLDNIGESKNVLDDLQHGREDEDGLFTL
ncbi:T-cell immunoglobulin and mucin domain-containing protein 4 isoform X2 [Rhinolophus sinicus]|uniref:T-cell immunoglobulin and mucin domain-containing protein 4 isoform X2 n=1 Tax=Rhinolophus sinicus TaxID=89399 RepID=UPI0009444261|nr:PREDICTED: T-cell immunoglobulin and mucin domain-containing protein 4 isoform X2 [Rhinolophus sinicus]